MDKTYADTVRLLLAVAPDVFANDIFAMKGGTAINLFVRDMPRLSVDIDVVYLPWQTPRDEALQAINQELAAIATRVAPLGVQTRLVRAKDLGDTKLIVENDANQVKIEVNVVFRGSVLPVERRPLSAKTSDLFGVEFELPVLAPDELYASKLVAALDRQHPRDLFDVWQLFESGDISDGMVECFVIYLAGHNRPPHEVLFGNDKDIAGEYERAFVGMTEVDCSLETLLDARARVRRELPQRLSTAHKQFLSGLARAEPDWSLVQCPARRATAGTALEARQSRNLPQAPSRRLRSAIRRPRHRLGPELTNVPQRPTCRDCPMPHSSWHPRSSGPIPKGFRQRPKGWEGAKEGRQGERPYPEKAKRRPEQPVIRGSPCSRCSSANGCHPPPAHRPPPPSKLRKG
jgi:predicted nucleotidyltransferase component of viral defense system